MDSEPATSDPEGQPLGKQIDDQCHDMSSLEDLANRGAWRSIVDKVSRARALSLLHKPHDHLTYLAFNALAFTKLRRFNEASAELDSLEDLQSPHYRYETYPKIYPNRVGSMVPFSLRWLHALIPIKLGQRQQGMDRFYTLLDFVRQKIREKENNDALNVSLSLWRKREVFVVNCIIGHHLSQKEFGVCLSLMKELLSRSSDPLLVSQLGYMQLQVGDLEGAKVSFLKVESEGKSNGSLSEVEFRNLVNRNKALMYLVGKDYVSAVREYEECIERDSSDVVAVNNKALCLMYLRDLSDSIKVLESALERVPTLALNETLVVNLCSMYELAYVNHSDIKRTLSSWIARVAPDDFDASCTRT